MELPTLLVRIALTIVLLGLVRILFRACDALILKPQRLRSKLRKQGIRGPPPSFLVGNVLQMRREMSQVPKQPQGEQGIVHNCSYFLFPSFEKWTQQYGSIYMFSLGNIQFLHINDPEVVKEIIKCTSLDFGRPSYFQKVLGPLLGKGILTSNGANWVHKRKTLAPTMTVDSVKGMMNLMVESGATLVDTWTAQIESEGGVAEIEVDEHLICFTTDVISRACFGSDYSIGQDIFLKIRGLIETMSKRLLYLGVPLLRHLPTKSNREAKRIENEVRALILKAVQQRKQATRTSPHYDHDIMQTILEGAENISGESKEQFIVDNLKNIYLAGYETSATCAAWTLMLLASNPKWQEWARAEVLEICGGQNPNADMLRKMKILTMVLHESLRLYPPVPVMVREAQQDLRFGDIHVPKGLHTWLPMLKLHQDPRIWGLDAHEFNPQRFADGVSGSCPQPHVFMPFGVGPRNCLGQNFALAELKILLALVLSNFSFSLSPNYRHSPVQEIFVKPKYGVKLLFKKL